MGLMSQKTGGEVRKIKSEKMTWVMLLLVLKAQQLNQGCDFVFM